MVGSFPQSTSPGANSNGLNFKKYISLVGSDWRVLHVIWVLEVSIRS